MIPREVPGTWRMRSMDSKASASRCFAAWQGETLTGFLWFTERQYEEDEVRCTFRVHPHDQAVWDLDIHIVPRFRFGRSFALLWASAFAAMRVRGVRWTISRVSAFKAESIRAHQRLGAQRTGWALFFLWGSLQLTLTSLGGLKCRRLQHGPYPVIVVRSPGSGAGGPRGTDGLQVETIAGGVRCWGSNGYAQLGTEAGAPSWTPAAVQGLTSGVQAVAAGYVHSCAIVGNGVRCWGENGRGQLGTRTASGTSAVPVDVEGLTY